MKDFFYLKNMNKKSGNNALSEKIFNLSKNKLLNDKKSNYSFNKNRENIFNIHFVNNNKSKIKIFKNRKNNSLNKFTKKFIEIVIEEKTNIINLQTITKKINVYKRRIYDITNVFEGNSK